MKFEGLGSIPSLIFVGLIESAKFNLSLGMYLSIEVYIFIPCLVPKYKNFLVWE